MVPEVFGWELTESLILEGFRSKMVIVGQYSDIWLSCENFFSCISSGTLVFG